MGGAPPSPCRAAVVTIQPTNSRRRRPVLLYDGKPTPFPLVTQPAMAGLPIPGQTLAETFREGA